MLIGGTAQSINVANDTKKKTETIQQMSYQITKIT